MIALLLTLTAQDAREALLRATDYFQKQAKHGGYVWFHSADGLQRFGEGRAAPEQIWVQPPGTPAVGLAFLRAYEAVPEPRLLQAAVDAGRALVRGRLKSGGWTYSIDFDPKSKPPRNYTTFDDDTTQCALRFLAELDRALAFKDAPIHEAVEGAVDALMKAQFPNGAFPQGFDRAVDPRPVKPAAFPAGDWRELPRVKEYWSHYTLNDGLAGRMVDTLLVLHRVYGRKDALAALEKLGDFLLLARCPEPQPAWAQQYDVEMRPAWARKFEPPAVTGWESQDVCEALMAIHEATKNPKYLEPVAPAIAYLRKSLLPDGRLARFYELKTNRPLYLNREYQVVYTDDDLPAHYGFQQASRLDVLERELARVKAGTPRKAAAPDVRRVLETLDAEGRWIEEESPRRGVPPGRWIRSDTFAKNIHALSDVLRRK
ncbi:MAG TPA: pectate lyase [Planctomycetota bacterium]